MITSVKQAQKIADEFNLIDNDIDRLMFIKKHKDDLMVVLDNDDSWVNFQNISVDDDVQEEAIEEIHLERFDDYFGNADGVNTLFEFIGIDYTGS